jgi:hypothetical protein
MARLGKPAARRFRLILKGKFQERSAFLWRMTNPKSLVRKEVRLDKRADEDLHRGTIGHTCQRPGRGSNR